MRASIRKAFIALCITYCIRYVFVLYGSTAKRFPLWNIETVSTTLDPTDQVHRSNRTGQVVSLESSPLRVRWRRWDPRMVEAIKLNDTQNPKNCDSASFVHARLGRNNGMGMQLNHWCSILCTASSQNKVLLSSGSWIWLDKKFCQKLTSGASETVSCKRCHNARAASWGCLARLQYLKDFHNTPIKEAYQAVAQGPSECADCGECANDMVHDDPTTLECYFDRESVCPSPIAGSTLIDADYKACPPWGPGRAAAFEYIFRSLPIPVIEQTERVATDLFRSGAPHVSIHMRWGDKWKENDLPSVRSYIEGVKRVSAGCSLPSTLVVFVMTEDPAALKELQQESPKEWTLLHHAPAVGMIGVEGTRDHSNKSVHSPMDDALVSGGSQGLQSVIALMLSLESSAFVLTGSSNWSRMWGDLISARAIKLPHCRQIFDVCQFGPIRRNGKRRCHSESLVEPKASEHFNLTKWSRTI